MEDDSRRTFTIITYNIDSQSSFQEERISSFIEQILEWKPDIITMQEVSRGLLSKLFVTMKKMGYSKVLLNEIQRKDIAEITFSKFPILKAEYMPFDMTDQKRGMSLYLLDIFDNKIWVCNVQLEGGACRSPKIRNQIEHLGKKFSKEKEVLIGGDFQIASYQKDIKEPEGWSDVWYEVGNTEEQYTMDSKINLNAKFQDRPDRIWFKTSGLLECEECHLVGIPKSEGTHLASNHFGLWAKFKVNLS